MSIFSTIKKIFTPNRKKAVAENAPFNLIPRLFGPEWTGTEFLQAYAKSLYVYACVSKIAEKVASIDFKLYRIIDLKGNTEEITDHPILDLLYKVNPFYTKTEFIMTDVINRKLTGDSFILKIRNNNGEVVELWNVRPDWVTIVAGADKYVDHYEILTGEGKREKVAPEDMIHIKYPSPLQTYFGLSPLSAARHRIDTEEFATKYQRDFFLNNARPDAIIEVESLTEKQKKELREAWERRHRGVGKSSKIGILTGGAKYHQISLSQREMDYIESMRFTRDDILVAFKVPKPIVAVTDDVNRANAETAMEIFLSETILPEMKFFVEKLNEELIVPDFGEEYVLSFEDPVTENREMRLAELDKGVDRWITINEARQIMGLKPVSGGDTLYRPLSLMPAATVKNEISEKGCKLLHGRRRLKIKFKIKNQLIEKADKLKATLKSELKTKKGFKKEIGQNSLFKDKEKRKQYWEYRTQDIDKKSKRLRALVVKIANEQKERFLSKFKKEQPKTKAEIRKLFNRKEENQIFKKAVLPLMFSIFREAGEDALSLLSLDKPFDIEKAKVGPTILELLEKRAMFFATSVNNTTLLSLTDTLAEGIENGEGIPKLEKRILEVYQEFSDYRAEMIARTETTAVVNEAHLEAYRQAEVVEGKEWVATLDDRVRDEHLMMDGEQVEMNKPFSNGLMYPCEPNCRCTIAPVIKLI